MLDRRVSYYFFEGVRWLGADVAAGCVEGDNGEGGAFGNGADCNRRIDRNLNHFGELIWYSNVWWSCAQFAGEGKGDLHEL